MEQGTCEHTAEIAHELDVSVSSYFAEAEATLRAMESKRQATVSAVTATSACTAAIAALVATRPEPTVDGTTVRTVSACSAQHAVSIDRPVGSTVI